MVDKARDNRTADLFRAVIAQLFGYISVSFSRHVRIRDQR
jgi:hypothetical protein